MNWHESFGIKVKNFKCFGDTPSGFDRIELFNVIIGRNNSGKSALIDAIERLVNSAFEVPNALWHKGQSPDFIATHAITDEQVVRSVQENESSAGLPGGGSTRDCCYIYRGSLVSKRLNQPHDFYAISGLREGLKPPDVIRDIRIQNRMKSLFASVVPNPFAGKHFRRLLAERHIVPELESAPKLLPNGDGATNLIQSVLIDADKQSQLIELDLLSAMNVIFAPDMVFTRIVPQRIDKPSNTYEIYIEEEYSGPIALSQSGSGIKSVMLALLNLLVMPQLEGKSLEDCVFGFEELENNLHPALLRRLIVYLHQFACEHGCPIFLTTHSNVAIDVLSQQPNCQLVHVAYDRKEERATCDRVGHYGYSRIILDDLNIRASDLLQSNGVIWVEGPSDKIYINRWIELKSEGKLQENVHYQILFYGGKLLSHLTAADDSDEDLISILTVNRNCCIVMDSDLDWPAIKNLLHRL